MTVTPGGTSERNYYDELFERLSGRSSVPLAAQVAVELVAEAYLDGYRRALAVRLAGAASDLVDERGNVLLDNSILMLFNASEEPVEFVIPPDGGSASWLLALDTAAPEMPEHSESAPPGHRRVLSPRSLVVFESPERAVRGEA